MGSPVGSAVSGAGERPVACPCGSGAGYARCCGRLHRGETVAASGEQLMRSRFSAFAVGDPAYLHATWHRSTQPPRRDLDAATDRDRRWTRLEIVRATGGFLDREGTVEFRAHWTGAGGPGVLRETSRFVRNDGRWVYVGPTEA